MLRGVALFGVLTVNLVTIFRLSLFQEFLHGPEDAWARAVSLGLEFKAVTLFSLLFGIGLEAQREHIDGFHRYILRRLAFLLVIGLVHLFLVWNGDVLTLYALMQSRRRAAAPATDERSLGALHLVLRAADRTSAVSASVCSGS